MNAPSQERTTGAYDRRYLVLSAMIFAVAMMFVDQTIVAIAVPYIQRSVRATIPNEGS